MKVFPFTIPKPKRDALILQEDKGLSFYELLHQHNEIQISHIVSGSGTLIVGDTICSFTKGDTIILGSNLPHVFRSNLVQNEECYMKTIFFTPHSFGADFFNIEELKSLQTFFSKSENGFKTRSKQSEISSFFKRLFYVSKLERFIVFLQLLNTVNQATYEHLSDFIIYKKYNDVEGKRMSAVFEYTMSHFNKEISLSTIAREAAMTKNAFCKYFKKRTNKTYITFLNELRIEESCKKLKNETEKQISTIAEQCGFQNISNFNRKFKQQKGITPRAFRKKSHL